MALSGKMDINTCKAKLVGQSGLKVVCVPIKQPNPLLGSFFFRLGGKKSLEIDSCRGLLLNRELFQNFPPGVSSSLSHAVYFEFYLD